MLKYLSKISSIILFFCLLSWHQFAFADKNNLRFEHISISQGLSQSSIYCQLQDRNGFIWIGTLDGLNKYDGNIFTVYRNNPDDSTSIINNLINALYEDCFGFIWIGTSNGLSIYNPYSDKFANYRYPVKYKKTQGNNQIHAIYQDQSNMIWIGSDIGIFKINEITGNCIHYCSDKANPQHLAEY